MTVYRLADSSRDEPGKPLALVNARYFLNRRSVLMEATRLAQVYAGMFTCQMVWQPIDRHGVVGVWRDNAADPNHEIRIDKGEIEDGPADDG